MKKFILIITGILFAANAVYCSALSDDYVDIASSYVQQGKYPQALNYINKALELDRGNRNLLELQNDLYKMMGRDDVILSADSLGIAQNDLISAIYCYDSGKYREAKGKLDVYLEKIPKSDFAYMLRAKANMNIDEMPSALRDIKSAQAISNNAEYELVEALILYNSGKYSQSRDILIKLSDDIQMYNVYKYLGLCDYKLGNFRDAVTNFDRAILLYDEDKSIMQVYNDAKRMSYGN